MGKFNLNLSTRPFPAYRIVNLALVVSLVVIAGLSVWQVYSYRMYADLVKSIQADEKSFSVVPCFFPSTANVSVNESDVGFHLSTFTTVCSTPSLVSVDVASFPNTKVSGPTTMLSQPVCLIVTESSSAGWPRYR